MKFTQTNQKPTKLHLVYVQAPTKTAFFFSLSCSDKHQHWIRTVSRFPPNGHLSILSFRRFHPPIHCQGEFFLWIFWLISSLEMLNFNVCCCCCCLMIRIAVERMWSWGFIGERFFLL